MMDIEGRVAVITGGGSGIGRGIALALAQAGADVVIADIDVEQARRVKDEILGIGRRALAIGCNVSDEASVEGLAERAWSEMGHVEMVFNNAGVVAAGSAIDATAKDLQWTFDVNVFGTWYGSIAFARRFLQRGVKGWICNTASENGIGAASIGTAIYTGTKHAVIGLTDSLRKEYGDKIGFSVLCPGIVNTKIWNSGRNRPEQYGGKLEGMPINAKAMEFGMDPEAVGRHVIACLKLGEFYIFTHPHVREIAEERWKEIEAAMARQWPQGAGPDQMTTLDVQRRLLEEMMGTQPTT